MNLVNGLDIALAISRRFPRAVARVRSQVRSCRICGGQSDTGISFRRVFRFPLPILIPRNAPYSFIMGAGTIGQLVANLPSGLSLTLPHEIEKIEIF
jgi:hypothetical protein